MHNYTKQKKKRINNKKKGIRTDEQLREDPLLQTISCPPAWWLSNRSNIFLTFPMAASLQRSLMSDPEYPSVR